MAKIKVEKETRRLMEGIADLVKKKGDRYKFKGKGKKIRKRVMKTCPHWIIHKHKEIPTVRASDKNPEYWECQICGARFPVRPLEPADYSDTVNRTLELVNQMQFWSVKLGGDEDDTKMFLRLRSDLPRFMKANKTILKRIHKQQEWDRKKKAGNGMSQFNNYAGYNYN